MSLLYLGERRTPAAKVQEVSVSIGENEDFESVARAILAALNLSVIEEGFFTQVNSADKFSLVNSVTGHAVTIARGYGSTDGAAARIEQLMENRETATGFDSLTIEAKKTKEEFVQ